MPAAGVKAEARETLDFYTDPHVMEDFFNLAKVGKKIQTRQDGRAWMTWHVISAWLSSNARHVCVNLVDDYCLT